MNRLTLAIDWDGVIWRTTDAVLAHLNMQNGTQHTTEVCTRWDWYEDVGLSKSDFHRALDAIHEKDSWHTIQPHCNNTVNIVNGLTKHYDCYVLTGKHRKHHKTIRGWMDMHGMEPLGIAQPGPKGFIKSDEKMEYEWDVLIDDAPMLVEQFAKGGAGRHLIHMASNWSRTEVEGLSGYGAEGHPDISVVRSWAEVPAILSELAQSPTQQ